MAESVGDALPVDGGFARTLTRDQFVSGGERRVVGDVRQRDDDVESVRHDETDV